MELTTYVESLQRYLLTAAETAGDEALALAERLTAHLDAATRLVLLDALSDAAAEVTLDLAPGSLDVRLRGRDPEFVVTPAPTSAERAEADVNDRPLFSDGPVAEGDGGMARLTLRLPEHLKHQAESAAARQNLSVNAWLIQAVADAVHPRRAPQHPGPQGRSKQSYTGWAR